MVYNDDWNLLYQTPIKGLLHAQDNLVQGSEEKGNYPFFFLYFIFMFLTYNYHMQL